MSDVPLALVRLTHPQLSRLAAEEPDVRWPRAFRALVRQRRDPSAPLSSPVEPLAHPRRALPGELDDPTAGPLLRKGLRAFGRPRLRLRVVLRQGRLLTLTEVAAGDDGSTGALSTLLLDGHGARRPQQVRPVGRVELAGTASPALPGLSLRHVPGSISSPPAPGLPGRRPADHPARTLVLRGWGRAVARPFVDAWVQDEHGWLRPVASCASTRWVPVDADTFAADLAAVLRAPLWATDEKGSDDE